MALGSRDLTNIAINISYDSACAYSVNVVSRFKTCSDISALSDLIERARIDSLHINDHQEKCMYLYSSNYQECSGHFHGVGTEQYWSENNQMGPQTRQMNPGHRHDRIIEHHSDWNWKKTIKHGKLFIIHNSKHQILTLP
jgi:hypothetical protein